VANAPAAAPEAIPPAPSATPSPGGNAEAKAAAPGMARAEKEKSKGSATKAPGERKPTVAVVGPPKKTTASATAPAAASATVSAADSARADEASDAKKTAGSAQRPAVQHLLKITSSPPGADVLIDGQSVGKTPYQAREIDAEAPHAVTIRLDGYESHEHMISASDWLKQKANLETAKVNVKLRKLAAGSATEPTAARSDGARAEPPKAEAATKVEAAPTEKTPEATPAPAATEPPKAKDDPATPPPPAR
jgi:serine/threonine-protein kinase